VVEKFREKLVVRGKNGPLRSNTQTEQKGPGGFKLSPLQNTQSYVSNQTPETKNTQRKNKRRKEERRRKKKKVDITNQRRKKNTKKEPSTYKGHIPTHIKGS
jgi:hypothetical protein